MDDKTKKDIADNLKFLSRVIVKIINDSKSNKPTPYDTTAIVRRIENGVAYVHIPGGIDETPVKLTIACSPGDNVQVRVSNGSAWIVGNGTAPPTDDRVANVAKRTAATANTNATEAKSKAVVAEVAANEALSKVGNSLVTDTIHYLATDQSSGVTTETAGWTTTVQSMTSTNRYLWTYHTYTKASEQTVDTTPVITGVYGERGQQGEQGPQGSQGEPGEQGEDGISVISVQPQYATSSSDQTAPQSGWSNELIYDPDNPFIWSRDEITYSDSSVDYSDAICNYVLTDTYVNAEAALMVAEAMQAHFWVKESGGTTAVPVGAYVTEEEQEVYDTNNPVGGAVRIHGNGIDIRKDSDVVAQFLSDMMRIGKEEEAHTVIEDDSIEMLLGDGTSSAPYFHVGMLENLTDNEITIKNRIDADLIRRYTTGATLTTPYTNGQWNSAYIYERTGMTVCPHDIQLSIDVSSGSAGTTNIFWIDSAYNDTSSSLWSTANVTDGDGNKLGWSTSSACNSAVSNYVSSHTPTSYLNGVQYGSGVGQMKTTIGSTTYTYYTFMYKNGHDWNPNYSVQCQIYVYGSTNIKYDMLIGGYVDTSVPKGLLLEDRCKAVNIQYTAENDGVIIPTAYIGEGLEAYNKNQFALGKYNERSTDTVAFVIGNGWRDASRKNCYVIFNDGSVYSKSAIDAKGNITSKANITGYDLYANRALNTREIDMQFADCVGSTSTAASTVTKVVSTTKSDWVLETGKTVLVTFTVKPSSNVSLNIDSTGSKAAYWDGDRVTGDDIVAGETCRFIYDGTYYQMLPSSSSSYERDLYNGINFLGWWNDVFSKGFR